MMEKEEGDIIFMTEVVMEVTGIAETEMMVMEMVEMV
jgi:hypothetical protein